MRGMSEQKYFHKAHKIQKKVRQAYAFILNSKHLF